VPDYSDVLVKVVAIFGVINRVAYLQLHLHTTFFYYSAIAHILNPSLNLTFKSTSGFKNTCRARAGLGLGPGSGFKMRPFYYSVWVCMQ